jgi:hypothetical protein
MIICPACKKSYRPGAYSQHVRAHARRGELVRVERLRVDIGNNTKGYAWNSPFEYVLPRSYAARKAAASG